MSNGRLEPEVRDMEQGANEYEPNPTGLMGHLSSLGFSQRRKSLSLSSAVSFQIDDDRESERVSEAGDIGDRALHSNRQSDGGSTRFSLDKVLESGVVFPICDSAATNAISLASPVPEEKEKGLMLPPSLEYVSYLIYLAVFGILGVLTRYLLKQLFGPSIAAVTSAHYPLYLDLPSNMVGSFLMGWWGVVLKGDISSISSHLAIGLTTGYLGSLTTFSGWNQGMLDLSVDGHWVFAVVGFLLGLFLAAYSIKFGVGTAKLFKSLMNRKNMAGTHSNWKVDTVARHFVVMAVLGLVLCSLWSVSGTFLKKEFNNHNSVAELWLACIVAPPGVWIRWLLARLNGRGLGKAGTLKWMPFGTLIANVSAACIMAALSTLKEAVNTEDCDTITNGIELGFLGCLSTVSTFIAEYNAMEESTKNWRAYVYALTTITVSFGLGTLIYSVPVWVKGYNA